MRASSRERSPQALPHNPYEMSRTSFPVYCADGLTFDLAEPDLAAVSLETIAGGLARLFRWRGNCPISVAQHSCYMADAARTMAGRRWCLVHDVPEIALGDLPPLITK